MPEACFCSFPCSRLLSAAPKPQRNSAAPGTTSRKLVVYRWLHVIFHGTLGMTLINGSRHRRSWQEHSCSWSIVACRTDCGQTTCSSRFQNMPFARFKNSHRGQDQHCSVAVSQRRVVAGTTGISRATQPHWLDSLAERNLIKQPTRRMSAPYHTGKTHLHAVDILLIGQELKVP